MCDAATGLFHVRSQSSGKTELLCMESTEPIFYSISPVIFSKSSRKRTGICMELCKMPMMPIISSVNFNFKLDDGAFLFR